MDFDWLNSKDTTPIGLSDNNNNTFEITLYDKKHAIVSNLIGADRSVLFRLICSVIGILKDKFGIDEIHQVIDNDSFNAFKKNWKDDEYEMHDFGDDYKMVITNNEHFLNIFRKAYN